MQEQAKLKKLSVNEIFTLKKYTRFICALSLIALSGCSQLPQREQPVPLKVEQVIKNGVAQFKYCNPNPKSKFTCALISTLTPIENKTAAISKDADKKPLFTVHFALNQYALSDKDKVKILSFASETDQKNIVVKGYTDDSGDKAFNDDLAKKRAESVKAFFGALGVGVQSISIESDPLCCYLNSNKTEAEKSQNRRAEVFIK